MSTPPADTYIPEPEAPRRLALALPPRSISAIVADLSRPLPQACVASKTQGGQSIPFLHWQTVARVLDTYAPGWHGSVTRIDAVGKACAITYRLTIPCLEGEVSREATGQEDEEVKGYGDSTSNGEAMAFKRAAAKFGLGAWLYSKDSTDEALVQHLKREKTTLLRELAAALDARQCAKEPFITSLRAHIGVARNDDIPITALKAALAHLSMDVA